MNNSTLEKLREESWIKNVMKIQGLTRDQAIGLLEKIKKENLAKIIDELNGNVTHSSLK